MNLVTGYSGNAHIKASDIASVAKGLLGDGLIVLNRGECFSNTIISNNKIRIGSGDLVYQGRHARIEEGDYIELDIDNGTVDTSRIDVIAFRYEKNVNTGVETADIVVIKGTSTTNTPVAPSVTSGNIDDGDLVAEIPLYQVNIDGITLSSCEAKFVPILTYEHRFEDIYENIHEFQRNIPDIYSKISALQPVDTGWVEVSLKDGLSHYSSSLKLRVRRCNNLVELRGEIKNDLAFGLGGSNALEFDLAQLDLQFRPAYQRVVEVMQGSGMNRFTLTIETDGILNLSRYGTTEASKYLDSGSWITLHSFYFAG